MTTTTSTIDLTTFAPIERDEAVELGRTEYVRFVDALETLGADEWSRPTDCAVWTVRDLAGHLAGAMRSASSIRRSVAEQRAFKRRAERTGEQEVDAMTAIQVERMAGLDSRQLVATMRSCVDAAARGRRRLPAAIARRMTFDVEMGPIREEWTLEYLLGPILTRDTWLHRVADLARAVDRPAVLDAAHDGRIVADVAAEWARRHGEAVVLRLDGPAGGRFVAGDDDPADRPSIEMDAVEFCRVVSGRAPATHPLLEAAVPF